MNPNEAHPVADNDPYYGNFNRAVNPLVLQMLRNKVKYGQLTPEDVHGLAVGSFGDISNNVKYSTTFNNSLNNQLFNGLGTAMGVGNDKGQFGQYVQQNHLDNDRQYHEDPTYQRQTTALHQSITSGAGETGTMAALRGGLGSEQINSIDQFDNPNSLKNLPNAAPPTNTTTIPRSGIASGYLGGQTQAIKGQLGNPGQLIKQ